MPARNLRIGLIAAGLLITTNGPLLFFAGRVLDRPGFPPPWEDVAVRPVLVALALFATAFVLRDARSGALRDVVRPHRIVALAIVLFPLWAVTSSLWSEQPDLTLWRALVYCGLVFLAIAIAALDDERLSLLLVLVTGPAVAVSAIVALARPSVGLNKNDFWQGIYTNPNSLGPIAALGVLAGIGAWAAAATSRCRVLAASVSTISVVVLYQTTSRTSWFALAIAIGLATVVTGARLLSERVGLRRALLSTGAIATAAGSAVALGLWSRWDDPTFAQRRTIWRGAWRYIDDRWVEGYGFFSFFEVPGRAAEQEFFDRGSAHSSFVEVLLGLGIVGLTLFTVVVVAALWNAVRSAWRDPIAVAWMRLAVVVFLVTENLTESFILWFSYNWVILCAAALRRPAAVGDSAGERSIYATASASVPSTRPPVRAAS